VGAEQRSAGLRSSRFGVAAQEAKNPQRDMPIGIIGSLVICTRQ